MPNPIALLRAHIALSRMTLYQYAVYKLAGRSTRCLDYWLSGKNPVPPAVLKWLESLPEYPAIVALASPTDSSEDSEPTGSP